MDFPSKNIQLWGYPHPNHQATGISRPSSRRFRSRTDTKRPHAVQGKRNQILTGNAQNECFLNWRSLFNPTFQLKLSNFGWFRGTTLLETPIWMGNHRKPIFSILFLSTDPATCMFCELWPEYSSVHEQVWLLFHISFRRSRDFQSVESLQHHLTACCQVKMSFSPTWCFTTS